MMGALTQAMGDALTQAVIVSFAYNWGMDLALGLVLLFVAKRM
jgi:hypothetical protein